MTSRFQLSNRSFFLTLLLILTLLHVNAIAKNPDLSFWTKNISEMDGDQQTGLTDYNAEIAIVGSTIHVMWMTDSLAGIEQIFYRRSTDGGQTWEPKKLIFSDNDIVKAHDCRRMAVDGNNVHIAFGYYEGSWYGVLGYIRSTDGGMTFEEPHVLFTADNAWHIKDVFVSAENNRTAVGFRYQCNWKVDNSFNIFFSENAGQDFILRTAYATDSGSSWGVGDMLMYGENFYILYAESYYYYGLQRGELFLAASSNLGESFISTKISVPASNGNHKTYPFHDYNYVPKLAASGNNVYAVWSALDSADVHSVFLRRSTDNGLNFEDAINLSRYELVQGKALQAGQETIIAAGNYAYCGFITTDSKVYLKRSDNSGANFYPMQTLTSENQDYFSDSGWWPQFKADPVDLSGATLHVLWTGPTYQKSIDGGATFTNPVLLGNFTWRRSDRPRLAIDDYGIPFYAVEGGNVWLSTGVFTDNDIQVRCIESAGEPATEDMALRLTTIKNAGDGNGIEKFDNMQIAACQELNLTDKLTIEAWINVQHKSGHETYFLTKETYGGYMGAGRSIMLGQWRNGQIDARLATTNQEAVIVAGDTLVNGQWYHVAMTYDAAAGADNYKVYINGELTGQSTATGLVKSSWGNYFIGGADYQRYDREVKIDELRFWNYARSQQEIQSKIEYTLKGNEEGLVAYYQFNGSTKDVTGNGHDGTLMYKEEYVTSNVTAISENKDPGVILTYQLFQNYPNPFNPKTVISYQLPVTSHLDLSIYNLLGQKIVTLVSEKQQAGGYNVKWDASEFTSGIYFYRLTTNQGYIQTRKMVLVR